MHEIEVWLVIEHVIMDRGELDTVITQCLQNRIDLLLSKNPRSETVERGLSRDQFHSRSSVSLAATGTSANRLPDQGNSFRLGRCSVPAARSRPGEASAPKEMPCGS